jgi:hypothetical protein
MAQGEGEKRLYACMRLLGSSSFMLSQWIDCSEGDMQPWYKFPRYRIWELLRGSYWGFRETPYWLQQRRRAGTAWFRAEREVSGSSFDALQCSWVMAVQRTKVPAWRRLR